MARFLPQKLFGCPAAPLLYLGNCAALNSRLSSTLSMLCDERERSIP